MRTAAKAGLLLATGAALGQAAPLAMCVAPLRVVGSPKLSGTGRRDHVALTFDDGPDARSTPRFIEALERLGVTATFFLLGSMTRRFPSVARDLVEAGHEVAVHGDLHRNHAFRRPADVRGDIARARDSIAGATGVEPTWFRPPYGALSWSSLRAASDLGLQTVLWSTWGRDWRRQATATTIAFEVTRDLRPGGTILLHDSDCTSSPDSWRNTLDALPMIISFAAAYDLEVGPLRDHA